MDSVVLLLNADYEPLNVCDLRRAFRLVFGCAILASVVLLTVAEVLRRRAERRTRATLAP